MGSTQRSLSSAGAFLSSTSSLPPRTPGPTGHQDAADPNMLACMPGDTPGPVGSNGDIGEQFSCALPPRTAKLRVLEVDLDRAERFLYSVAYAHAADAAAKPGFFESDLDCGDQTAIEATAKAETARLMYEMVASMTQGSAAVQRFLGAQADRKDASLAALNGKLRQASRASQKSVERWGYAIKGLAAVRFTSTAVLKVASIFAPPAGAAIDISYDVAQEGISYATKSGSDGLADVVVGKALEESVKEAGEMADEFLADQLLSPREAELLKDWFKRYKGDHKQLAEKMEWLAKRLEREIGNGKRGAKLVKKYGRNMEKVTARLSKLNASMGKGLGKKALGKGLSVVFVADDIRDAWGDLVVTWNQSN